MSGTMIPGRAELRRKPEDPKAHVYERNRARDSYKKQLEIFKIRHEAALREFPRLDFDAKQEIRIRAKRLREKCLSAYRDGLQGLATSAHRRQYKDVFLGDRETAIEMHDPNVLEYELRLAEEIDSIISNLSLLKEDQSNQSTLDWMANLSKQRFAYDYTSTDYTAKPDIDLDSD